MGSFLGQIVTWVLSFFFKKSPPLTQEAQQAANAAALNVRLNVETQANAQVAQAIQAERQSDARAAADPLGLREPSADSRD